MPESTRSQPRRAEDLTMAEKAKWSDTFKRWAFLWPVLVAAAGVLGFRWVSPNTRIVAVEQAQAQTPKLVDSLVKERLHPIDSVLGEVLAEQAAARIRDGETRAQQERIQRLAAMGLLVNCTQLSPREREWARQLAQVCDETSQRTGVQYRPPSSP